ncbi:hypothetical protein ADUPG1_006379 [Aduncisulcus paluster]|uniref:Uncharacterized protein n=1 Tax=Aduncisulcus paluster TaxID=2918883 RepID=A0ABQ5KI22_9EUKA|nr:hypothetical protein ADUPG1_006379 [Aduncisulcus paluster]
MTKDSAKVTSVITAEMAPKMPRLEDLTSTKWSEFMNDFDHYRTLGGLKEWPEMVDITVLGIIRDLEGVSELRTTASRKKAKTMVDKIFGASSTLNLYDELRQLSMNRELAMDALMRFIKEFKAVRSRAEKLGEDKPIVELFIAGLYTGRLRECVRA